MNTRKILIATISFILIGSLFAGTISALDHAAPATRPVLNNVRAFAPAASPDGLNYAVDGGHLFAGTTATWTQVDLPSGVIANAVVVDGSNPQLVYVGAANELALYRSADGGQSWLRVPLTQEFVGGVTALAVDSAQRLVYVGTDTAGLFRLRDVGSSMLVSGHLQIDEPVLEVAADSTGAGLVFARTAWTLYRAEEFGLRWFTVENLGSVPTALQVADTTPATIYVGTTDRGLLKSHDGLTWTTANEGLGLTPGARLQVDALAVDPQQPAVLYVATSYLFGSTTLHQSPVGVATSSDGALSWTDLSSMRDVAVAELMPVAGHAGSVYALTTASRTPLALGNAAAIESTALAATVQSTPVADSTGSIAWVVAALAALALGFAVWSDIRQRTKLATGTLTPRYAEQNR